jgi:hypothetical protein
VSFIVGADQSWGAVMDKYVEVDNIINYFNHRVFRDYNDPELISEEENGKISYLTSVFVSGDEPLKDYIRMQFGRSYYPQILWIFAIKMAEASVRERSTDFLFKGLIAIVIEDFQYDPRDSITSNILHLLRHSAVKVGANVIELFESVMPLATKKTAAQLLDVAENPVNIHNLGYIEVYTENNFYYLEAKYADNRFSIGLLARALEDKDEAVRLLASTRLEQIIFDINVKGKNLLAGYYCYNVGKIKQNIAEKLGYLHQFQIMEKLIPLLEDPNPAIRRNAAIVLGRIGDQRAVPALKRAAHLRRGVGSKQAQEAAQLALTQIIY